MRRLNFGSLDLPRGAQGALHYLAQWLQPAAALALLAGALAVQSLPQLPPRALDAAVALLGGALTLTRWRWCGVALLAAAWTAWRADLALAARLPHALEGVDLVLDGRVVDLPRRRDDGVLFEFDIAHATRDGEPLALQGRVRLGWYDEDAAPLAPCTRWQLAVRLKRPRGLIDPGAFDFERYALERGLIATGRVRPGDANRALGRVPLCLDGLRRDIVDGIDATLGDTPSAHLMRALAFGDQHAMDEREWATARATGIPHLIAISGLHIALFASFGIGGVRLLWKLAPRLTLRWPAPALEAVAALAFALAYAALAGFALPTRRALVMLAALLLATLARRARAPLHGLALALVVLLACDPLGVLSAGFWLSFVGVAWLMFCLGGRRARPRWREAVTAQGVASVGLLPLGIWFFGQSSLIGPPANLVAVPAICFCVLPLTVLGACLLPLLPLLGAMLLHVAGAAMDALWWLLLRLAECPGALWYFPEPGCAAFVLASAGSFWLLLPRGAPARALGAVLLLPLLIPARPPPDEGEFVADVLDVGQGLAVLVRTRDHALLYDTGARFASGFDLGDAAVVPALHALGVRALDRVIVSHGDNDHAGGAAAVLAAFATATVESGEPERLAVPARQCLAGESWTWNGVAFRLVHPHAPLAAVANDRCCVLDVRTAASELVLSGDVSAAVEPEIAQALAPLRAFRVLQVPHHGSKTSSSEAFVTALSPSFAPISAGYRNSFHHPHPAVLARYAAHAIPAPNTAQEGFLEFAFGATDAPRLVERGRADRHPYWRE